MQPVVTTNVIVQWIDASGSKSTITLHTLSSAALSAIEAELTVYTPLALALSNCAVTEQEVTYREITPTTEIDYPAEEITNQNSLVLVFGTTNPEKFFTVVLPSPKVSLFTSDAIPVIDEQNADVLALAAQVIGNYCTPDGYTATQLLAAVFSREF